MRFSIFVAPPSFTEIIFTFKSFTVNFTLHTLQFPIPFSFPMFFIPTKIFRDFGIDFHLLFSFFLFFFFSGLYIFFFLLSFCIFFFGILDFSFICVSMKVVQLPSRNVINILIYITQINQI